MAYWRLFYHFVWTTKNREPLITPDIEPNIYRFLHNEAKEMYAPLFIINGMPDHIHVLTAVRPAIAPADFMKQLKGSSSRFVTAVLNRPFEWQVGYGVLTVSEKHVPPVISYVKNQKQHHAQNTIYPEWEETNDWNLGPEIPDNC